MNPYDKRNLGFKIVSGVTTIAIFGSGFGLAVLVTHLDKPKSISVSIYPQIKVTVAAQPVVAGPKVLVPPSQPPTAVPQPLPSKTTTITSGGS